MRAGWKAGLFLTIQKNNHNMARRAGKSCPVLSDPFRSFPLMGHGLGHGKSGKIQTNISGAKAKKSS